MNYLTEGQVLDFLYGADAIKRGVHARLASGECTNTYVDVDLLRLNRPDTYQLLCQEIGKRFLDCSSTSNPLDAVIGPAEGGNHFSNGVARYLASQLGYQVNAIQTIKVGDTFRVHQDYCGLLNSAHLVLVVDDVYTTGRSMREVVWNLVRVRGKPVVGVGVLVDRSQPIDHYRQIGCFKNFQALVHIQPESWLPAHCPLCRAGIPINAGHHQKVPA